MNNPTRGELWDVDFSPGRGSEQTGIRPALVVQCDPANRNPHYPNTIIVVISSKGKNVPFHVVLEPGSRNGLTMRSFVKCEQLLTISKERLIRKRGALSLTSSEFTCIEQAIRDVLTL